MNQPTPENIKTATISLFVSFTHGLAIWQLSELFYKRLQNDKEKPVEYWCPECDAGPFPNKRSLDGHVSRAHKYRRKMVAESSETSKTKMNGVTLK